MRTWRRARSAYYGWWLLGGSVLGVAIAAGVSFWSFGLYVEPLEDDFGWSRAQVSGGFSISLLASGLAAPLIGNWIDRYGTRRMILIGALLTAATYALLSTTDQLWQWYAYSSLNAVFRQMMFFIPFQTLISRWFERRRGLAVGILGTGFSLGGFVVVPFMRIAIDAFEWQGSFLVSGVVIVAIFVPLSLFLVRDHPADVGATLDGETATAGEPVRERVLRGINAREALRTPLFWVIAFALMMFFYGMFGWMIHAIPYYESIGISPTWAAGLVSIAAGGGTLSRLAFGYMADRIPSIEAASVVIAAFLACAMLTLLISGGSVVGLAIFITLWIVGSSGGPMIEPLLLTRAFGVAYFASILGVITVVETSGQIVSPAVAGAIFDATGSYDWALVMFAGAMGVSLALFWVASRMPRPELRTIVAGVPEPADTPLLSPAPAESPPLR